uniref:Putative zn2+ transporter znt1 n=1 Tax=Culex tarsalis TaxID=7177 RepID=A0A1Q3FCP6_CULTA
MPMKEWIYRLQPVQLYIVLVLSIVYFLVQLFLSHISHSLVLLVDSYHMLCNIIALSGCILTIKHSKKSPPASSEACRPHRSISQNTLADGSEAHRFVEVPDLPVCVLEPTAVEKETDLSPAVVKAGVKVKGQQQRENSLRNTFGWARIDVLTMLVVCIFMASFCFSVVVEALQTLSHIHHQDAMHFPIPVLILGALGIVLNGFCYLLIGGYTYHQGSFLYITSSGNVVLDRVVSGDGIRKGERRLSGSRKHVAGMNYDMPKRQSVREMMRDVCSTLFVIICSMIVHYTNEDEDTSKFVDPLCSVLSCVVLMTLSYPYMKESGMILLQTIPDTIDIEIFERTMLKTFPDIVSVHDLHIWQLSSNKYVSTAHVIFENPKVYSTINDQLIDFFHDMGINQVTIQPEFSTKLPVLPLLVTPAIAEAQDTSAIKNSCLMQCRGAGCLDRHCCGRIMDGDGKKKSEQLSAVVTSGSSCHGHSHPEGAEQIPMEVQKPQCPPADVPSTSNDDSVPKEIKTVGDPTPAEIQVTSSTSSECGHTH